MNQPTMTETSSPSIDIATTTTTTSSTTEGAPENSVSILDAFVTRGDVCLECESGSCSDCCCSHASTPVSSPSSTSSPRTNNKRRSEDDESYKIKRTCPLSNNCTVPISRKESLVDHLRNVHHAAECNVSPSANGFAQIELEAPISIDRAEMRRSALVIHCEGDILLWTMESVQRADGETQVGIVVRLLENNVAACDMSFSEMIAEKFDKKGRRILLTLSAEKNNSNEKKSNESSSVTENGCEEDEELLWSGLIDTKVEKSKEHSIAMHDRLISMRKGLIMLHPTHKEYFQTNPNLDEGERQISVKTKIQILS